MRIRIKILDADPDKCDINIYRGFLIYKDISLIGFGESEIEVLEKLITLFKKKNELLKLQNE